MHYSASITGLAVLAIVNAHCKITYVTSDLGGSGVALGLSHDDPSSTSDVTLYSDSGLPFGVTLDSGPLDPYIAVPNAREISNSNTLPQIQAGSTVSMNLYQINEDGAGPMRCYLDSSGRGVDFTPIRVTIDVPGNVGIYSASQQSWPLEAIVPSDVLCKGDVAGQSRICFVKCLNPMGYGGSVAVQQVAGEQRRLELRSEPSDGLVRNGGKQGNKVRGVYPASATIRREGGRQGNKARDYLGHTRREDEGDTKNFVRKEGKQGNKVRSIIPTRDNSNTGYLQRYEGRQGNKMTRDVEDSTTQIQSSEADLTGGRVGNKMAREVPSKQDLGDGAKHTSPIRRSMRVERHWT